MMESMGRLFLDLKTIDLVAAWKATSIAITGAFGIVGLLTDFRNKEKKITAWGWVSLTGIVVSSVCGFAAQLRETQMDAKRQSADVARALSILQKTSDTVNSIDRMMTSLVGASVDVSYSLNCTLRRVSPCATAVREENLLAQAGLTVYFFADPAAAKRFTEGAILNTKPDLEWLLTRRPVVEDNRHLHRRGPWVCETFKSTRT